MLRPSEKEKVGIKTTSEGAFQIFYLAGLTPHLQVKVGLNNDGKKMEPMLSLCYNTKERGKETSPFEKEEEEQ